MLCHKNKILFIHIPKCAGSSIEYMFNYKPFDINKSNRLNFLGWDDKIKCYLQHISTKEIFENNLISDKTWNDYNKFTIVRNPWSRALSAYVATINDTKINDSFENFLFKKGKFDRVLNDKSNKNYRGHYQTPQIDFIKFKKEYINIFKMESLDELNVFFQKIDIKEQIPHKNKTPNNKNFNEFYLNNEFIKMVEEVYENDIKIFNYSFK